MEVEKIDHIHIYVKDLEKARDFFAHILGSKFSEMMDVEAYDIQSLVNSLGIELVGARSKGGPMEKIIEKTGEGLAAISLKVPDIEKAIAELKAKGLRMTGREQFGKLKEAWFHPDDAFGVMIELCEYEAGHSTENTHPAEKAFRDTSS
ncbi:VOC family protein [bacterium]|nr:VOC family protein [bacterium]